MKHECKELGNFYDVVEASYKWNNWVNRIEIEGTGDSKPYPKFRFECPPGFVQDQNERRGKVIVEYEGISASQIFRSTSIIRFLGEFYRIYDAEFEDPLRDLSAHLFMDGFESGDNLEILLKQD